MQRGRAPARASPPLFWLCPLLPARSAPEGHAMLFLPACPPPTLLPRLRAEQSLWLDAGDDIPLGDRVQSGA